MIHLEILGVSFKWQPKKQIITKKVAIVTH